MVSHLDLSMFVTRTITYYTEDAYPKFYFREAADISSKNEIRIPPLLVFIPLNHHPLINLNMYLSFSTMNTVLYISM